MKFAYTIDFNTALKKTQIVATTSLHASKFILLIFRLC